MRRFQRGVHPDTRTRGRGGGQRAGNRNWAAATMLQRSASPTDGPSIIAPVPDLR